MIRLLTLGLFAVSTLVLCQAQAGDDKKKAEDAAAESVNQLTTAFRLVEYGRKTKSPEALITAAGILLRVTPANPLQAEVKADDGKALTARTLPSMREEAADLLKEARTMAGGDKHVLGMADIVENRVYTRGGKNGPSMIQQVLPPKSHHTYTIPAVPGAPFVVGFRGQGNTMLHVTVRYIGTAKKKGGGNILVFDQLMVVGQGMCVPPSGYDGAIHVKVHNQSSYPSMYLLTTN